MPTSQNHGSSSRERLARFARVLRDVPLPAAFVDLEAFEHNVDTILEALRATSMGLRVASKSLRSIDLVRRACDRIGDRSAGVMAYAASEALFLARQGFRDVLVAYPSASARDALALVEAQFLGARASIVVDDPEQLEVLSACAAEHGVVVPVVLDLDVSWRPGFASLHLGVRRSPLRSADEMVALARRVRASKGLALLGVMSYEAHFAGLPDGDPSQPWKRPFVRLFKSSARPALEHARAQVRDALCAEGVSLQVFNGGGTGSVFDAARSSVLTEVTAGSGFMDSTLFDHYTGLSLVPALFFALQAARRPCDGMVTCHGGGYIASGPSAPDRLPTPVYPEGSRLLGMEGAGEVQTPVRLARGANVAIGDPVIFRPAKAGELAERFVQYYLIRGDHVEHVALTYRGMGECFV